MPEDVALVRCTDYRLNSIERALDAVEEMLELGPDAFPDTERVLLKPNLISAKEPDKAVTTHPALVEAVARRLARRGYEVFIGDSPGGAVKGLERYWRKTGMDEVARSTGAALLNFERSGSEAVTRNGRTYTIANPVREFRFILNLPKLKTHVYAGLTGAVKNLFGVVPGLIKAGLHQDAPRPDDFAARMLDIYEIAAPTFHIADGVTVMDTRGPSRGRVRLMDCLMASRDGVALDRIFARLAGCRTRNYLTGREARRRGYAAFTSEGVNLIGETTETLKPADFKVPGIGLFRFVPGFLGDLSRHLVKAWPVAEEGCTACRYCVDSCPADAIAIENHRAVMDRKKCILCLCCHELCPEGVVDLKRSFLARKIFD